MLNAKHQLLKPSATFAMASKANARRRAGLPVYNLGIGELHIETPEHIKAAAQAAIQAGHTRYTASGGMPSLKEAIIEKCQRDYGITAEKQNITCANGGKQILFNLFQVLLQEGDEVLVSAPAWLSYADQIQWAGGHCTRIPTKAENNFSLTAEALAAQLKPETKAVIINSPANPTGAIIPESELAKIAELLSQHHCLIICDDVYEHLYSTEEKPKHLLQIAPELQDRCLLVNSVSKTYAMTGWRLGYAIGPEPLIKTMETLQSQSSSNPCSISQHATVAALTGPHDFLENLRHELQAKGTRFANALQAAGLTTTQPQGAFYLMIHVEQDDQALCEALVQEEGLALVPGSVFGQETQGWVRASYAVPDEDLKAALEILLSLQQFNRD